MRIMFRFRSSWEFLSTLTLLGMCWEFNRWERYNEALVIFENTGYRPNPNMDN